MGKVKIKSLRRILFKYSFLQIVLMLFTFMISVQIHRFFQKYSFYKLKGDNGVVLIFITLMVMMVICLNRFFSHMIATEVRQLTNQVEKLQEEKLDTMIGHSGIAEIEQTLRALEKLQSELEHSLNEQWRMEKLKNDCIIALGHDMKTPIAILKGNSELLAETELNQLQRVYNESNLYNVHRMQQYTEALIEGYKSNSMENCVKEYQNFNVFFNELLNNYRLLAKKYSRTLKIEISQCGEYSFDALLLERAVNNIVMNAFDYTEVDGIIKITLVRTDSIHLMVEDSGKGFSDELLKYATEAFVRGDKSRRKVENELHLGLGLYQTKQIMNYHEGRLMLSNSKTLGGAKIELILK